MWIVLIVIVVLNVKWLNDKHFSFTTEITNLFNDNLTHLEINTTDEDVSGNKDKKDRKNTSKCKDDDGEVFNIPNNVYNYSDAAKVCKKLNSRLATFDEVEDAYNNGATWCSYGWSDDQMALFPIQKSVYNELKQIVGHEHDCGRPGINGGYMSNSDSKFGVNCYGKKPYMTDEDKAFMDNYSFSPSYTDKSYNKSKKVTDLLIAPFNKTKWSFD